jgi:hypothetical protein
MNKNTTVLLPDFPPREHEREFNKLGFNKFERFLNAKEREIAPEMLEECKKYHANLVEAAAEAVLEEGRRQGA